MCLFYVKVYKNQPKVWVLKDIRQFFYVWLQKPQILLISSAQMQDKNFRLVGIINFIQRTKIPIEHRQREWKNWHLLPNSILKQVTTCIVFPDPNNNWTRVFGCKLFPCFIDISSYNYCYKCRSLFSNRKLHLKSTWTFVLYLVCVFYLTFKFKIKCFKFFKHSVTIRVSSRGG